MKDNVVSDKMLIIDKAELKQKTKNELLVKLESVNTVKELEKLQKQFKKLQKDEESEL